MARGKVLEASKTSDGNVLGSTGLHGLKELHA